MLGRPLLKLEVRVAFDIFLKLGLVCLLQLQGFLPENEYHILF